MLQTLLAYGKGAGIENRWLVLDGDARFFAITKRLHNLLHGEPGDGGPLGPAEHAHYEAVLRDNLADLGRLVSPRDIVLLHDPQTAGLAEGAPHHGRPGGLALPRRARPGQRPHDRGLGVPSALPRARPGTGVLPAGVRPGVGRGRTGWSSSRRRSTRSRSRTCTHPGRVRHRRTGQGRTGGGRRPGGTGRLRAARRHTRDGALPPQLRWAAGRRRPALCRRAARRTGEQVGPAQGHGGRDGGLRPGARGRRPRRRRT